MENKTFTPPLPTMDTLAVLAGVSRTLISYYVWNRFNEMSPATRERLDAIAEKVGFRPYGNDEWFEARGRALLLQKGYDPDEVRDTLRSMAIHNR